MNGDFQKFIIIGRLVRDPELKKVGEYSKVELSLANNKKFKDKEKTTYIDAEMWGKGAEVLAQYCSKGKKLFLEGEIEQQSWETDGQKRSKLIMRVENFTFLDGPNQDGGSTPKSKSKTNTGSGKNSKSNTPVDDDEQFGDDDIPF